MDGKRFKHSDAVWHRVVQVIQEAMLMGVDCVDLLRQVEVCEDPESPTTLMLSPEYVVQVEKMHQTWLERAMQLQTPEEDASTCEIDTNQGLLFKIPTGGFN